MPVVTFTWPKMLSKSTFVGPIVIALTSLLTYRLLPSYLNNEKAINKEECPLKSYPVAEKIETGDFNKLFGSLGNGRKYNSFILFNALDPGAGCPMCPWFKEVATNFPKDEYLKRNIAFATVDLDNSQNLFMRFEIQTAPWMLFFKAHEPGKKPEAPVAFSFSKLMDTPNILSFVNENLKTSIRLKRARSKQQIAWMIGSAAATVYFLLLLVTGQLNFLIFGSFLWTVLGIGFVLLMNAGVMYAKIRGLPLFHGLLLGRIPPINPGLQHQLGPETLMLAAINLFTMAGTVMLSHTVPKIRNQVSKRIATLLLVAVVAVGFSLQARIFAIKTPGYKFTLLF